MKTSFTWFALFAATVGMTTGARVAAADSCKIAVTDAIDVGCLPALTSDRASVLVPVTDPDGGRGNPNLAVRVLSVSGKGKAKALPVISAEEWDQWDGQRAKKTKDRVAAVDHALDAGFATMSITLPEGTGGDRQDFDTTVGDLRFVGKGGSLTIKRGATKLASIAAPAAGGRGECRGANWSFPRAVYIEDNVAAVRFDQHGNDTCQEGPSQWVVATIGPARPRPQAPGSMVPTMGPPDAADHPSADALWQHEAMGPLQYGMSAKEVTGEMGAPKTKSPIQKEEATGAFTSTWEYPGVKIVMSAPSKSGAQKLVAMTIDAPSKYGARGIHVGSTVAELARAYEKSTWSKDDSNDERVVIGSLYGGIIFTLADHKVVEIFVGAAGE